jgi:cytochrome P450 family 4
MYKNEKKLLQVLHGFTDSVIKARRDELLKNQNAKHENNSEGVKTKMALLDLLLQATIDGEPLTNEDIREEVDVFMFGGHDTTTSGISFCLFNIGKHPEVQRKIFAEIEQEIGDETLLTLQNLSKLHYLELVIKESLRLFPPVPYYARKLKEETTIGGFTLPAGSNITVSPLLMGRDPEIFPDPLEFIPERFDVETTAENLNPYAYVPFSAGPRNCIGQKFAMNEMKSIICKIVKNFELFVPKKHENLDIYGDLVLKSDGGIVIKFTKRNLQTH